MEKQVILLIKAFDQTLTEGCLVKEKVSGAIGAVLSVESKKPWANEAKVKILTENAFYKRYSDESFLIEHLTKLQMFRPTKLPIDEEVKEKKPHRWTIGAVNEYE